MPAFEVVLPKELDSASVRGLRESLERAQESPEGGVIVLRGTEHGFCRGLSLETSESDSQTLAAAMTDFVHCLLSVRTGPRPVIAMVAGPALGGGLGLAAASDVLLAREDAVFGLPEGLFGLTPATIFPVLVERMSPQRARLLALSGRSHPADADLTAGLADEVVAVADCSRALARWVRDLSRCGPGGSAGIKRLGIDGSGASLTAAIERGAQATLAALQGSEVRAAVRAFAQGDPPWEVS